MKAHILFILTLWSVTALSQTDTLRSVAIDAAVIEAVRVHRTEGMKQDLDSLRQWLPASSVGELLQFGAIVPVVTYGPAGNVISVNDRGLSSDHLLVSWNGIPLNTPSLGSTDLAAIPAGLFNNLQHLSGVASTAYSSGTGAGMLDLDNLGEDRPTLSMSVTNTRNASSALRVPWTFDKRFSAVTALQFTSNTNAFSYNDPYLTESPERTQDHNNFRQEAFLQEVEWQLVDRLKATAGLWLQRSDLNIPNVLGSYGESLAQRADSSARAYVALDLDLARSRWRLQAAELHEFQRYTDRISAEGPYIINSSINTRRRFVRASVDQVFRRTAWGISAEVDEQSARSANYLNTDQWNSRVVVGLAAYAHQRMGKWMLRSGLRLDQIGQRSQMNGDLQLSYAFSHAEIFVRSRSIFRYPDLNELYWRPGGNTSLEPERGLASELGTSGIIESRLTRVHFQGLLYAQQMRSLIVWLPEAGVWNAQNREEVLAYGLETNATVSRKVGRFDGYLGFNGRFQLNSISEEVLAIRYPAVNLRFRASVKKDAWTAGMQTRFVSNEFRHHSLNRTEGKQDATLIYDLDLGYTINSKFGNLKFGTLILNVFDIMDHRVNNVATPGRVVNFNLIWKWKDSQNTP